MAKRNLTADEQETIVQFCKGGTMASIFTYEQTWQKHLEAKLGLKPVLNNGYGGKAYELLKAAVPMPRAKRRYSEATKKKMATRLAKYRARQKALF